MSQVDLVKLTKEFVAFSDITTVDADTTYYIQNRGPDVLVALEASSTPDEELDGVYVPPYCVLQYKQGEQNLYLRAGKTNCSINVSKEA